jgi:drug/metabolite transporter (DMT)-like permease
MDRLIGVLLIALSAVCFGTNAIFARMSYDAGANPGTFLFISTVLGLLAFYAGLKRIDTANAAIISTFEVVVVVTLAIIILGETISLPKIIGACMVITAVVILAKREYETAQAQISQTISR